MSNDLLARMRARAEAQAAPPPPPLARKDDKVEPVKPEKEKIIPMSAMPRITDEEAAAFTWPKEPRRRPRQKTIKEKP